MLVSNIKVHVELSLYYTYFYTISLAKHHEEEKHK